MKTNTFFYEYGEYDPDKGWLGNKGIGYLNNFMPITGGYSPGPYLEKFTGLRDTPTGENPEGWIDGEFLGGIMYQDGLQSFLNMAVSGGTYGYKVYIKEINSLFGDEFMEDVTPGGWSQGTGNSEIIERWGVQFCIFGTRVFMTDGISGLFYKEGNDIGGAYQAISPAAGGVAPIPKVIASHGGHLLLGDITLDSPHGSVPAGNSSNLIWYSKFDDPQTYGSVSTTPQHKGTDFKFLYDTPGGITKIVPAGDVVFVFKEKAIYIGEGPPFRWTLLSSSTGTQFPNSTGFYNNGVYFMSDSGPAHIGRDGQVTLLLEGKAQRALIGTSAAFDV